MLQTSAEIGNSRQVGLKWPKKSDMKRGWPQAGMKQWLCPSSWCWLLAKFNEETQQKVIGSDAYIPMCRQRYDNAQS